MYACWDRNTSSFGYLSHHDDTSSVTKCVPLEDVVSLTRLGYYAARLIKILAGKPIPP